MKIIPTTLSSFTTDVVNTVKDQLSAVPISNRKHVRAVLAGMQKEQTLTSAINYAHELQRLQWAMSVDNSNSFALNAIERNKDTWKNFQSLGFSPKQITDLGGKLYNCGKNKDASVALIVNDYSRGYSEEVLKNCLLNGNPVGLHINDDWAKELVLAQCQTEEQAQSFALTFRQPWDQFDRRITLKSEENSFSENEKLLKTFIKESFSADRFKTMKAVFTQTSSEREKANKHKLYTLTSMPCPQHAALDGVSHKELLFYYYNMCMPDSKIFDEPHDAMGHVLDNGNDLVIQNNEGTYLSMSIKGMTTIDSRTLRNLPGCERYTAPVKESVNGVFASKERYAHKGQIMQGLHIEFKDGRIINYKADKGHDVLSKIIEKDEGSHYLGEVGFGTNFYAPNYQPSLNIMAEKRVGVHIAIGRSYTDTIYDGKPVYVNNGNVSQGPHKDLTLNMIDTKGSICVDGRYIMEKGIYILPGTGILNTKAPAYKA